MIEQTSFQKSIASEIAAIDRLLAKTESAVKRAFLEYLKNAKSEETLKTVRRLLEQGNVEGVIQYFERLTVGLTRPVTAGIIEAGIAESRVLAPKAVRATLRQNGIQVPQVAFQFDPANPRAEATAKRIASDMIREINDNQRAVIRQTVSEAQINGDHPLKTTRKIRDEIGLTERQRNAVENYRRLLTDRDPEALTRGLREKGMDERVKRAIKEGKSLSPKEIDRMVEAYRKQYIAYRADVIARTEAHTAVNVGREEALDQTIEQAGIDPNTVYKKWMATRDKRTRDTHSALNGTKVKRTEPFVTIKNNPIMFPGDPNTVAEERVQCRCTVLTEFD